jgi:hypothetical protein
MDVARLFEFDRPFDVEWKRSRDVRPSVDLPVPEFTVASNAFTDRWTTVMPAHGATVQFHVRPSSRPSWRRLSVISTAVAGTVDALVRLTRAPRPLSIRVVLIDLPFDRESQPGLPIGPRHVNGGLAMNGVAVVYRRQELIKVMMHEIAHLYGVGGFSLPRAESALCRRFGVAGTAPARLGESVVDFFACCGSAKLHSHLTGAPLRDALRRQRRFVVKQAGVVRAHFARLGAWREDTHAFAYFVAKAALFDDADAFAFELVARAGVSSAVDGAWFLRRVDVLLTSFIKKRRSGRLPIDCSVSLRMGAFAR